MVATSSLNEFRTSNQQLSDLVQSELADFFSSLDLSKPEAARDALLEFVPLLVEEYGPVAETLAMDFYEQQRIDAGASGRFRVTAPPAKDLTEPLQQQVRFFASNLWTPEPQATLGGLLVKTDKFIKQAGRDVFPFNARRERVRWARVPSGSKTCSWCLILASRDAVYLSKQSAAQGKDGDRYHGLCDCVPTRIGNDEEYPDGFLPTGYYDMYMTARDDSGSSNIKDIAASMRRLYPDQLNDGVHSHAH